MDLKLFRKSYMIAGVVGNTDGAGLVLGELGHGCSR